MRATAPAQGTVAVQRGYIRANEPGPAGALTERIWAPAGPNFPNDTADAQPVVAAFALDRVTGDGAVLARRVSCLAAPLTAAEEAVTVELENDRNALGFVSLLDSPLFALSAAMGRPIPLPIDVALNLPQPGWTVGRWWLHTVWQELLGVIADVAGPEALETAVATAAVPPNTDALTDLFAAKVADVAAPPRDLAASWAALAADQMGPQRLGAVVTADEAQWLPQELLGQYCVASTPAQRWLWAQITALLDAAGRSPDVAALRARWEKWPELHEPETFVGATTSNRR